MWPGDKLDPLHFLWRKEARLFAESEELKSKSGFQRFEKMGEFATAPVENGTES